MYGSVRVPRALLASDAISGCEELAIFMHLLLRTRDSVYVHNGVKVLPGEVVWCDHLAKRWVPKNKNSNIRPDDYLLPLMEYRLIETEESSLHDYTIIRIIDWEKHYRLES